MSKISLNNAVNDDPETNPKIFSLKAIFYILSPKSIVLLYLDYLTCNIL